MDCGNFVGNYRRNGYRRRRNTYNLPDAVRRHGANGGARHKSAIFYSVRGCCPYNTHTKRANCMENGFTDDCRRAYRRCGRLIFRGNNRFGHTRQDFRRVFSSPWRKGINQRVQKKRKPIKKHAFLNEKRVFYIPFNINVRASSGEMPFTKAISLQSGVWASRLMRSSAT